MQRDRNESGAMRRVDVGAKRAGAASALLGFIQLGSAAGVGVAVGHALGDNATPMVLAIFLSGIASFAAFLLLVRPAGHSQPADA